MGVDQKTIVDAIGTETATGVVVLTIADQIDWVDPVAHLRVLQDKINGYLQSLQSGEIVKAYPGAKGRDIRINVIFRFAPPKVDTHQFLSRAYQVINNAGYAFSYETLKKSA
jgi:hypothetical protein